MSGPRQIQPLVFLQETQTGAHPAQSQPSAPSFADYVKNRVPVDKPEPAEEQLSFRRYVNKPSTPPVVEVDEETKTAKLFVAPQDDVPDV